jgi:DNA-binding transcriptional LysR family regulator
MHFTLRQLSIFEAVARHLSYTQAAAELHLTQPAVSMQIRQLETNLGLPLFEQLGKKIYLTQAGREMFRYSRAIAQQLQEVEEVFAELKGIKRGKLAISVASTANYFAARLLAAFCKQYQNITFSLDVTNRERLLQQLENNEKDLVIMGQPPEDMDLISESFMENPLVVIAPPDHPLAQRQHIPLEELVKEHFVVREPGSGTRIAMERFFAERQLTLSTSIELTRNESIKQAVAAGLGLGIVSIHTLDLELSTGNLVLLNVESFPILRYWYIVHRRGKRLSPIALAFKEFVLREAVNVWPKGTHLPNASAEVPSLPAARQ